MKKSFLIFLAVLVGASVVITAFLFMRDRAPEQGADEQPEVTTTTSERDFEAEDLYEAGPDTATQTVTFTQMATVEVNALRDLPTDGNVLKVHTVCIDDSTSVAYAAGIMTSERNIVSVDPTTGEVRGEVTTPASTAPEIAFFYDLHNLFAITTPKAGTATFYDATTLAVRSTLTVGEWRNRWFVTADGSLLLVNEQRDEKTMTATWYDAETFRVQKTETIPVAFAQAMGYDVEANALWIAARAQVTQVPLDDIRSRLSFSTPDDIKQVMVVAGKVLAVSKNGYDTADEPGFMGGLLIADAATGTLEQTITLPWQHSEVGATEDGEAILVNNDGNSITLIDLASGETRVVAVGSAAEAVAIDGDERNGVA